MSLHHRSVQFQSESQAENIFFKISIVKHFPIKIHIKSQENQKIKTFIHLPIFL